MEISSKNIDDVYINFKTMLPTNNRSSITLCHFQFGFQGMFDPRLEKNEEGLYDAPHIELIWMMNTGKACKRYNKNDKTNIKLYIKSMRLLYMTLILVLLKQHRHQHSHQLLVPMTIKFQQSH